MRTYFQKNGEPNKPSTLGINTYIHHHPEACGSWLVRYQYWHVIITIEPLLG